MKAQTIWVAAVLACGLMILALGCDESETVAPDGSTISLTASPATIVTSGGVQANKVLILATLRNSIGVPLPGQDVRFTTTSGLLDPTAGTPIASDKFGNATTTLTQATRSATITAQSGKATASQQLEAVPCEIATIALSTTSVNFDSCDPDPPIRLTATVTDTDGEVCVGVLVTFRSTVDELPPEDVQLQFSPGSEPTNTEGKATTTISLANDCGTKCTGMDCNTSNQQIEASAGGITSEPVTVNITI